MAPHMCLTGKGGFWLWRNAVDAAHARRHVPWEHVVRLHSEDEGRFPPPPPLGVPCTAAEAARGLGMDEDDTSSVGSNYLAALEAEERELEMLAAEMGG